MEKYGRFKGRIIAVEPDTNGNILNIVFENGGVIISKPFNYIILKDDYAILAPQSLIKAEELSDRLEYIKIQFDTVKKILDLNLDIASYHDLIRDLINHYYNVKFEVNRTINSLEGRKKSVERRIEWIKKLIFYLHMGKESNSLNNKVYLESYEKLDQELFRLTNEMEDIEYAILNLTSKISDIDVILDEIKLKLDISESTSSDSIEDEDLKVKDRVGG